MSTENKRRLLHTKRETSNNAKTRTLSAEDLALWPVEYERRHPLRPDETWKNRHCRCLQQAS